ncbi:alpha/beta hydrolase [Deinococcus taeanensis]|uniref:alpha/beta fold hydrolase n=1 Tax=Deinococcus taeanensis TaxID=2737050 RepID=UPI001CDC76D1|nr:alpha/beta hydrolase [Deinococcus taeanensis]UBV41612.1 alpha/beta hydrolase [Deinococcus taeanensis]
MIVRGTDLHVEQRGHGHPLVMLHGLGSHSGWMARDIAHCAHRRRVVAIDSRGHGRSARPAHFTLNDHVQDVLGVMDALNLERTDLMGTSMGSYVAQALAAAHPDRITRLILVVPKASGRTSGTAALMAAHAHALRDLSPQDAQAYLLDLMFAPATSPAIRSDVARLAAQDQADGLAQTPEQAEAARRALENFDVRPGLGRVQAPALIISGQHDPLNPPAAGEEIARLLPNAQQVVLSGSGHFPGVEERGRYLAVIDAFLTALPA